ncbi:MAG: flagellar brake protein [Thermosulfidibacteraceae bacterium]|jgi:c-di-GMP-binding flagellar brake protein YcgR
MDTIRKENIDIEKVLNIGQSIIVKKTRDNTHGHSNLQDMDSENIYIMQPTDEKGLPVVLLPNDEVMVSLIGKQGKRYGFYSKVTKHIRKPFFLIGLKKPKEVYVVELREYFRVPVFIPFKAKLAEAIKDETGKTKYVPKDVEFSGYVHDISGGGMFITTNVDLKIGNHILITTLLEKEKMERPIKIITKKKEVVPTTIGFPEEDKIALIDLPAKIVRKVVLDPKEKKYGYGIMFDIDEKRREKIILFCFNKQRELKAIEEGER